MNLFNVKFLRIRSVFIVLVSICVLSCSSVHQNTAQQNHVGQPGEILYDYLSKNINDENDVRSLLESYEGPDKTKLYVKKFHSEIAILYAQDILSPSYKITEKEKNARFLSINTEQATALFALYPVDTAKWMRTISKHSTLTQNEIYESAIAAGLDPSVIFAASASGFINTATPLINSVGIVIYGQDEDSVASVRFREEDDTHWRKGLDLSWEPIYGAFAGSIVYLNADTTYFIEVAVTDSNGNVEEHKFQTKTKPNSPPIDPDKIYYLSEIYSGGQLDLEALNIQGAANGYAKIIGDGPVIEAGNDALSAVNIGNNSYIMLENLTVTGGERYGIFAKKAHHIWIKGCNVSGYGRRANDIRDGIAYSSTTSSSPINYDSGIYLERSGIAVIEECEVHSPNLSANSWQHGHPKGANALQVWAYHDSDLYRGEFIVRNNRFYGSHEHRFNDVIEGRMNTERRGGFVKNSAIYGNYLAYANDDVIEIDGGQQNVLVYNNEIEQGYAGISIAPNTLGPSYIFHNHIHNLGDETGKEWTAIKAGGLIAKPAGRTFIFENVIDVERNGIAASRVNGDTTFWVTSKNNIVFTQDSGNSAGYCIFDKEKYIGSTSINDLCFNQDTLDARYEFNFEYLQEHAYSDDIEYIESLKSVASPKLFISDEYQIPNFSGTIGLQLVTEKPEVTWELNPNDAVYEELTSQYEYGATIITAESAITLTGNNWQIFPIDYELTGNSMINLELAIEGSAEIIGIGFETDKDVDSNRVVRFVGSQNWGIDGTDSFSGTSSRVSFPIGKHITGQVNYLVLVLDNDKVKQSTNSSRAIFKSISITEN